MPILLLVGVNSSNFFSRAFAFKTTSRPFMAEDDRLSVSPMERAAFPADRNWRSRRSSSSVHFIFLLRAIKLESSLTTATSLETGIAKNGFGFLRSLNVEEVHRLF